MIKILLIEDCFIDQEIFRRLIDGAESLKVELKAVETLAQARATLAEFDFDLIVSDLGLPDCDSIECLGGLKKDIGDIPIVILTGTDDSAILEKATHLDIYDFLVKSDLSSGILRRSIQYALGRFEARQEKRKMESNLRQIQRVEALGKLTGGIAHDFNNKLAVILGNLEMIKAANCQGEDMLKHLLSIEETAKLSVGLTKQLLAFGRQQELLKECTEINQAVLKSLEFVERMTESNIQIEPNFYPRPLYLEVDLTQLDQVLMNLLINARDAIGTKRGWIKVDVGLLDIALNRIPPGYNCDPGSFVKITVSDNGGGIPESVLNKIFEPFFSTKGPDKGTGLGLSVVDGIVNQLGGFIQVDSTEGVGTSIHIYLREVAPAKEVVKPRVPVDLLPIRERVILYVEDEGDLRKLTANLLKRRGFKVITALDGEEALAIFQKHSEEIDVILTDVIMPKLGGRELMEEARKINPDIGVIFSSGYSAAKLTSGGNLPVNTRFHEKPAQIMEIINSVLFLADKDISGQDPQSA